MAHPCPDCGMQCYCGGDIDDLVFDDTPEQDRCMHCDPFDDEHLDDDDTDDAAAATGPAKEG